MEPIFEELAKLLDAIGFERATETRSWLDGNSEIIIEDAEHLANKLHEKGILKKLYEYYNGREV